MYQSRFRRALSNARFDHNHEKSARAQPRKSHLKHTFSKASLTRQSLTDCVDDWLSCGCSQLRIEAANQPSSHFGIDAAKQPSIPASKQRAAYARHMLPPPRRRHEKCVLHAPSVLSTNPGSADCLHWWLAYWHPSLEIRGYWENLMWRNVTRMTCRDHGEMFERSLRSFKYFPVVLARHIGIDRSRIFPLKNTTSAKNENMVIYVFLSKFIHQRKVCVQPEKNSKSYSKSRRVLGLISICFLYTLPVWDKIQIVDDRRR